VKRPPDAQSDWGERPEGSGEYAALLALIFRDLPKPRAAPRQRPNERRLEAVS
jgi:hypothetical protein